jgi:predicted RNA binding protein YcfA (HicA-like mRNA interferase family)
VSKAPRLTGKQLVAALAKAGFVTVRARGSHHFLRHADGRATVVPVHAGETAGVGLLAKILRDADVSIQELIDLLT